MPLVDPHFVPNVGKEDWERTNKYVDSFLIREDKVLEDVVENSIKNGLPDIAANPGLAKYLQLVARGIGAKRILEIGTLGGYSAIWMGRALPDDGEIITLEVAEHNTKVAKDNLAIAGLSSKSKVIIGPAIETLQSIQPNPAFDLVFIDADMASYHEYLRHARRLLRSGGVVIADNVVRWGKISDSNYTDSTIDGIRLMLQDLKEDDDLDGTVISYVEGRGYDGLLYAIKK